MGGRKEKSGGETEPMRTIDDTLSLPFTPLSQIFRGDPVVRMLHERKISPLFLAVAALIYGLMYTILFPLIWGLLPEALKDWPTAVIVLVVSPLILGYYIWEPYNIQELYDGLRARVRREEMIPEHILKFTSLFGMRIWSWIALLAAVLQSAYIIYFQLNLPPGWQNINYLMIALLVILRFISVYALFHLLFRKIISIYLINRFMQEYNVEVAPLHPDRAGGLKVLGRYVLSVGFIIGVVGLLFGMTLLRIRLGLEPLTTEFIIDLVVYALAAPTLFVLPLWQAHRLMIGAREKIILDISKELEEQFFMSMKNLREARLTSEDADGLKALEELYDLAEKIPTWPLDFRILSQFGAVVLLPVILPVLLEVIAGMFFWR